VSYHGDLQSIRVYNLSTLSLTSTGMNTMILLHAAAEVQKQHCFCSVLVSPALRKAQLQDTVHCP